MPLAGATYTIGLDLGQARNHTALVVLERIWHQGNARDFLQSGTAAYSGEYKYTVVAAERLSLMTPYTKVAQWVKSITTGFGDQLGSIVVDASGVGTAVMDTLKSAQFGVRLIGVVVTGTQATPLGATQTAVGNQTVSRTELLTKLQVLIQNKQFKIDSAKCRERDQLRKELSTMQLEGKKPGTQDDLAFALALALWWGVRR